MKVYGALLLIFVLAFSSESCEGDCYEDPNLVIPQYVQNIVLIFGNPGPTYIGSAFFPYGTNVNVYNSVNLFYSVRRFDPALGMTVTFFWSESVDPIFFEGRPYPYSPLEEGEDVTIYTAVFNNKLPTRADCAYSQAKEIETELKPIMKYEDGKAETVGTLKDKQYNVAAGNYAVFDFPIRYEGPIIYSLGFSFGSNGTLVESSTDDNTFEITSNNLNLN